MYSITSEKSEKILQAAYYFTENDISITACAKKFGIHRETLANKLIQLDIHEDRRRMYTFNQNYFKFIDNEEKAYWLGFILADGSLHKSTNKISIGLGIDDISHLKKFKKSINADYPIKIETRKISNKNYKSCRIVLNSQIMYSDLLQQNIDNYKSTSERPCDLLLEFIPHYIRGIFDGDGWLSWNNNCAECGFGMGYEILNFIRYQIETYANVKSYKIIPYKKIYRYRVTSKVEIKKLLDYMYGNATLYLDRKYEKYQKFCRLYKETL